MAQMSPGNAPAAPALSAAFLAAIAAARDAAIAAGLVVVDNGDQTLSLTPSGALAVADNGDGTLSITA